MENFGNPNALYKGRADSQKCRGNRQKTRQKVLGRDRKNYFTADGTVATIWQY